MNTDLGSVGQARVLRPCSLAAWPHLILSPEFPVPTRQPWGLTTHSPSPRLSCAGAYCYRSPGLRPVICSFQVPVATGQKGPTRGRAETPACSGPYRTRKAPLRPQCQPDLWPSPGRGRFSVTVPLKQWAGDSLWAKVPPEEALPKLPALPCSGPEASYLVQKT